MTQPFHTNKLIKEKSPYLLKYANTLVDWFPWSQEAFERSIDEDKPVFLSIGHMHSRMCSMMLHDYYENPEIAAMMNEYFVNVKVDKDELPHIAQMYAAFAQLISVSQDSVNETMWPLNLVLTPERLPFFLLPCQGSKGALGQVPFSQLLENLHHMWVTEDERMILQNQARKAYDVIVFIENSKKKELLDEAVFKRVLEALYHDVDALYGGINTFPKKLQALLLHFILRCGTEYNDSRGLFFVDRSLKMMSHGGIFDHISGGFYTYSLDDKWLIPCLEKYLIENASMALNYAEAWAYTGTEEFYFFAKEIISYLLSNLYDATSGAFFHSEQEGCSDQLSNRQGAKWLSKEKVDALGTDTQIFCDYYGVSREGLCNGNTILHIPLHMNLEVLATKYHLSVEELQALLHRLREILKQQKQECASIVTNDLSLTFNNGWMVSILVYLGKILGELAYIRTAEQTMQFIQLKLTHNHNLFRRWCDGESKYFGILKDYAAVMMGGISLFEAGQGAKWLLYAEELAAEVLLLFRADQGEFYSTDEKEPLLLLRRFDVLDDETISGGALLCRVFLRLHFITQKRHYLTYAENILQISQPYWQTHKLSSLGSLIAAQEYFTKNHRKIFISLVQEEDRDVILSGLKGVFLPHTYFIWLTGKDKDILMTLLPENEHVLIPSLHLKKSKIYMLEQEKTTIFADIQAFLSYLTQIAPTTYE